MKAITVKQPWASLIVEGIKDIENRTWKTNFRGRVLIHSASKQAGNLNNVTSPAQKVSFCDQAMGSIKAFECVELSKINSAIIGSVEIIDCVINHPSVWAEKTEDHKLYFDEITKKHEAYSGAYPTWNWVLANPIKFEKPIENVKGRLMFWESCYECGQPAKKGQTLCENHMPY